MINPSIAYCNGFDERGFYCQRREQCERYVSSTHRHWDLVSRWIYVVSVDRCDTFVSNIKITTIKNKMKEFTEKVRELYTERTEGNDFYIALSGRWNGDQCTAAVSLSASEYDAYIAMSSLLKEQPNYRKAMQMALDDTIE